MVALLHTRRRVVVAVATVVALVAGLLPLAGALAQDSGARDTSDACDGAPEDGFTDTGSDGTALEEAIDCISWYGITGGVTDDEYRPSERISRAQMATMIAVSMRRSITEFEEPGEDEDAFTDDDGSVHEQNIDFVAKHGVVQGKSETEYAPTEPVTRAQMATFIVNSIRAIGAEVPSSPPDAFDDDEGSVHEGNIDVLASLRIATGTGGGEYDPQGLVTRGQMALFIARDLDYLVEQDRLAPPGANVTLLGSPELVMVEVEQGPVSGTATVRYVFDEAITEEVTVGSFRVYDGTGTAREADDAQRDAADPSAVVAVFPEPAVAGAVVAGVVAGAVEDPDAFGNPEASLPMPDVETIRAQTQAPDLVRVVKEPFNENPLQQGWQVTFTFDEDVAELTDGAEFAVYAEDGSRTVLPSGLDSGCDRSADDPRSVVCRVNQRENGAAATAVENSVLGGVVEASVADADGNTNTPQSAVVRQPAAPEPGPTGTETGTGTAAPSLLDSTGDAGPLPEPSLPAAEPLAR